MKGAAAGLHFLSLRQNGRKPSGVPVLGGARRRFEGFQGSRMEFRRRFADPQRLRSAPAVGFSQKPLLPESLPFKSAVRTFPELLKAVEAIQSYFKPTGTNHHFAFFQLLTFTVKLWCPGWRTDRRRDTGGRSRDQTTRLQADYSPIQRQGQSLTS